MVNRNPLIRVTRAAAVVLSAAVLIGGCGTQYGGPPSSIPRDVDSDDATAPAGTGSSSRQPAPQRPASPSGTGAGTSTGGAANR